jgi:succinate dehydrogenase/fumarate reductase flavoprotein subunit
VDRSWDEVADVLVVGSGAGALAAAVTAADNGCDVKVLEAAEMIGGTSSISGGMPWVPCNRQMAEAGLDDSREEALAYLRGLTQGREPDWRTIEAYVEKAAEALAYLEDATPLRMKISRPFSDYFADQPGGKMSGRTLDVVPYPARQELGDLDQEVRVSAHIPLLTQAEMAGEFDDPRGASATVIDAGTLHPVLVELAEERRSAGIRTSGGALITSLLKGAVDRGVEVRTNSRVLRLVVDDGEVRGVIAEVDGGEIAIGARRGVVLAAGGFEWNADLVKAFLGALDLRPLSPPHNRGDALIMGLEVGASIANMATAWGMPAVSDGKQTSEGAPLNFFGTIRQEPGVIAVNRRGRRFSNEAASYMLYGQSHRAFDSSFGEVTWPNQSPVWLVFDQAVRDNAATLDLVPGEPTPDWVEEASTLAELADSIGVPEDALDDTVGRWNESVEQGEDRDFGRGTAWFEGFTTGGPGPHMLAKIETPPFYALPLYDGAIGTAGGLLTDDEARVVSMRGEVIPGLYAVGNAAASAFGPAYPGGGASIGQGLTFGYIAGLDVAPRPRNDLDP